jgi:type IX secretion system PorP/SprF family membrane protein
MRKRLINIILLLALPALGFAQIDLVPLSSLYMFNGLTINPAYAGSHEVLSGLLSYRQQWSGFNEGPDDKTFAIHSPVSPSGKKDNFTALGMLGMFQTAPGMNSGEVYIDYAFHIKLPQGKLSLGLQAGVNYVSQNYNLTDVRSWQIYGIQNPAFTGSEKITIPNFGFGVYYYTDRFYVGGAIPRFFSFPVDSSKSDKRGPVFDYNRLNILATTGYVISFSENFRFKPSCMIRYQQAVGLLADINASLIMFRDIIWIGASYRTDNTFIGMLEIQVNSKIKLGYAYDYALGAIKGFTNGSHEFLFRYELNYRIKAVNPKFF